MYASALSDRASLFAEHAAAWATRSNEGRIEIAGDLELAQAANASLYFLRSSIRPDWPYGMSPGGLASNGYDGNTFWDQETWMWPNLLLLDEAVRVQWAEDAQSGRLGGRPCHFLIPFSLPLFPLSFQSAASCLRYRFDRLDQARIKARSNGYAGAQFPWQSAFTGTEVCADKGKVAQWGLYEQHIRCVCSL